MVGRFLSEDATGFNAAVDFYEYVKNNSLNTTDPTGLYSMSGFSPAEAGQVSAAVGVLWAKLLQCPSCVPDPLRGKILNMLQPGSYGSGVTIVKGGEAGFCGYVNGPFDFYLNRIEITSAAFGSPSCQCPLPGTLLHELVHLTFGNLFTSNPQREDEAHATAAKCFGKGCEQTE